MHSWLFLIPVLPLCGALVCGALHARDSERRQAAGWIASAATLGAFVVAALAFVQVLRGDTLTQDLFRWISVGDFDVPLALGFDQLSGLMSLIVTGVGFLIHVYSIGYMADDAGKAKYFAFLNLFIFAMSLLVLGSNLPVLFIGWEGVGLMSYLLIGFWYDKEDGWPAKAGQKAFIANRVGDMAFLIGMFLLFREFGTLDFAAMKAAPMPETPVVTAACLLLFAGACGKSAQIPLYVWLPDAMAGPTPVSALIHAATMVTAGVYMVCRTSFLFTQSWTAMLVVAAIGAATALVAATIALCQRDIKKVLAYSTVSQLGYMFLACGAGAFSAAIFHLTTHAFFKALLFLGAGSVIHGMHEEQDVMRMGGLRKHMPVTWITFLIGGLCLAGLPLTSGFFSKDEILWATVRGGTGTSLALWAIGAATALLTAFYTFRLVALTFLGEPRFDAANVHPHESPRVMTVPLIALALLALCGGALGLPEHLIHVPNWTHHHLAPVLATAQPLAGDGGRALDAAAEGPFLLVSAAIAILGILAGLLLYRSGPERGARLAEAFAPIHVLLYGKWFVDEIYELCILGPLALLSQACGRFDLHVVDGAVNGVAATARRIGQRTARLQNGHLQTYALWMAGGTAVLVAFLVWVSSE